MLRSHKTLKDELIQIIFFWKNTTLWFLPCNNERVGEQTSENY